MEKTATLREAMALAATEPAGPRLRLRHRRGTLRSLLFWRFRRRGGDPSYRKDRARDALPASTGCKYRMEDLFLLHPPLDGPASERRAEARRHSSLETEAVSGGGGGLAVRRSGSRRLRPVAGSFRCRLVRRAWRPVLLTIPD